MSKTLDSPARKAEDAVATLASQPPLHAPGTASLLVAACIATIAWLSLAAQGDITVHRMLGRGMTFFDGIERLGSYLTNLTIFVVAITFSAVAANGRSPVARFFRQPQVVTAVVVYIVFVGLAYNVLLRHLWTPSGYRAVLNECLHTVVPLLCTLYWVLFVPRFHLRFRHCVLWMIYPLTYLCVTLWRGGTSDFYPYPFIDVSELGYPHVLFNASLLVIAFVVLMGIFVALNHRRGR